ncbi:MAG TPA: hypothetical protein VHN79_04890 [Lacunisphaera sp.]|nr:hypothetical protein [Lacunisphaera sp.]
MKCYSVVIGARNSRRRWTRRDERTAQEITLRHFPAGCSFLKVNGAWYDPEAGSFRREEAREIVVTTRSAAKLNAWCQELGRALGQRELLVLAKGTARRLRVGRAARNLRRIS